MNASQFSNIAFFCWMVTQIVTHMVFVVYRDLPWWQPLLFSQYWAIELGVIGATVSIGVLVAAVIINIPPATSATQA